MIHDGHQPELVDGQHSHAQAPHELGGLGGLEAWDGHPMPSAAALPAAPREHLEADTSPLGAGVAVRAEGQDLSGGHQGVDVTIALTQPAAGGNLNGSAVQQLLGRDYQRLECRIAALDGPIMVATTKEQAEAAYGQGAGASTIIPGPWSWIASGAAPMVRRNCDEVWVAIPGPTAATTHVQITVSRRLGVEPPTIART